MTALVPATHRDGQRRVSVMCMFTPNAEEAAQALAWYRARGSTKPWEITTATVEAAVHAACLAYGNSMAQLVRVEMAQHGVRASEYLDDARREVARLYPHWRES